METTAETQAGEKRSADLLFAFDGEGTIDRAYRKVTSDLQRLLIFMHDYPDAGEAMQAKIDQVLVLWREMRMNLRSRRCIS